MRVSGTDIYMIRGDTEAIKVTLRDVNGVKVDLLEGDTIYFTVKTSALTTEITLQKIVTEFIDGEAHITIHPEDTKELSMKSYRYDIQLTTKSGTVKTIVPVSAFTIEKEVTYD